MLAQIRNTTVNQTYWDIYNCLQWLYKFNTRNCRFASSETSRANNVTKRPLLLREQLATEQKCYDDYPLPMPKWPLTMVWWMNRIWRAYWLKDETFKRHSRKFYDYLNKWYTIIISINASLTFQSQRFWPGIITGGKWKYLPHITCLRKSKEWKFYIVNSRPWVKEKEVESLYVYNVFKKWEDCWVILA